jgi:hypothetical protein
MAVETTPAAVPAINPLMSIVDEVFAFVEIDMSF